LQESIGLNDEAPVPDLLYKELTGRVLGAYYAVYNGTSRNYPEFIYENGLTRLLRQDGITHSRQPAYEIMYKDRVVGRQQLDVLLLDQPVVIECKVASRLKPVHKAQLFSYMKTVGAQVGLLLNFGAPEPKFERLYFDSKRAVEDTDEQRSAQLPDGLLYPELVNDVLGVAIEVHRTLGPGFVHRVYANACYHEHRLRGIGVEPRKEYQVIFRGESIGSLKFAHFRVEDRVMHFPVAIQNVDDLNVNNLKDWMRHQQIRLGILTNFHDTAIRPVFIRA
jgi:GxxExxY protein